MPRPPDPASGRTRPGSDSDPDGDPGAAGDAAPATLLPPVTLSVAPASRLSRHGLGPVPPPGPGLGPRAARTGDVIGGRYVVEAPLGRGGMGRVLRVRHQVLGKPFALKLIRTRIATEPRIREMFYREARLASALTHDHICSIVDFGEDPELGLFMVMELLDGQSVHHRLATGGRLPPKVACDVMWQVCDAVRYMHGRAILHGDLKSDNIFLVRSSAQRRAVKLLDFGLSRADLGRGAGSLDGTPEYLAPERIDGAPATVATDVYALGIVFTELLTGHLPFTGEVEQVFAAHRARPVPPPSTQIDEPLDERADAIVARATAKRPADRHADVAGLMYELRTLMNMLGMDTARRRAAGGEGARVRRDHDSRGKAASEAFHGSPLPMAVCDGAGKVRVANHAFLEFLSAAGDAAGIDLRDSGLTDVCPTFLADLRAVATTHHPLKRLIYLLDAGGGTIEAALVLSPAPATAEVTAGEVFVTLHPLRAVGAR